MCAVHGLPDSEAAGLASIFEATDPNPPANEVMVPEKEPKPTPAKPAGSLGAPTLDVTPEGIELNADQLSAISLFTELRGTTWKKELKTAWETGEYGEDVDSNLWNHLEQVKTLTASDPKFIKKLGKAAAELAPVNEAVQLDEKTRALKVLLPNVAWDGKSGPDAYEGHTEGVWIIITDGDKEKGEGVLVNAPVFDSYKGIKMTDVIKYKTMVASMKPIIFDKIEVEVGDKPKDEPADEPGEEPEVAPDEEPTGPPSELEPSPEGPSAVEPGSASAEVFSIEKAMDVAVDGSVQEALKGMIR